MNSKFIVMLAAALTWIAVLPFASLAESAGIFAQDQTMPAADTAAVQSEAPAACGANASPRKSWNQGRKGQQFEAFQQSLSPDQQEKVSAIRDELRDQTAPLRAQMKDLREQLQADPTGSKADELRDKMTSLRQQFKEAMKSGREKMMAVLTDDQRAKLNQQQQEQRAHRKASVPSRQAQPSESNTSND